jgi:small subunit ribosomal protein S1
VEIEEGVDGLIHISDLSWTKKVKHPSEFTHVGEIINVMVLEIDKENRRLSLGHKQLEENPWDVFEDIFTPDSVHEGTVIEIFDKGAIVALPYGVEGFVTPKHMTKEDGTAASLDEKLNFKVMEFNKSSKRIILSHSRTYEEAPRKEEHPGRLRTVTDETKKATKKLQASLEKTTFGDITELAALKEEMEATEKKGARKKRKSVEQQETEETVTTEQQSTMETLAAIEPESADETLQEETQVVETVETNETEAAETLQEDTPAEEAIETNETETSETMQAETPAAEAAETPETETEKE